MVRVLIWKITKNHQKILTSKEKSKNISSKIDVIGEEAVNVNTEENYIKVRKEQLDAVYDLLLIMCNCIDKEFDTELFVENLVLLLSLGEILKNN